jgi:hypothetical protein
LRDTVEPYIRVEVNMTGDVEEAQHDHRQLFTAFRDGDAREPARLSRLHVTPPAAAVCASALGVIEKR